MTYTLKQLSVYFEVTPETVRNWIIKGELAATQSGRRIDGRGGRPAYVIEGESVAEFCRRHPKYVKIPHPDSEEKEVKPEPGKKSAPDPESGYFRAYPEKNHEGYSDPTAARAMRNIEADDRYKKVISTMLNVASLAGFHVEERIVLVDKRTGRGYK